MNDACARIIAVENWRNVGNTPAKNYESFLQNSRDFSMQLIENSFSIFFFRFEILITTIFGVFSSVSGGDQKKQVVQINRAWPKRK
jgi:hypothetical protein